MSRSPCVATLVFLANGNIITSDCNNNGNLSTDGGVTWSNACMARWWRAAISKDKIYFIGHEWGMGGGIYISTDMCTTWTHVSTFVPEDLLALPFRGILAGTNGGGLYLFNDNGDSLGTLNEGLTNLNVYTLAMNSLGYVYAGTDSGVFKIPVPQITGVREQTNNISIGYSLDQNYPNPFNPVTIINYQLPVNCQVTLKVYNLLGQEVVTLVNEMQDSGYKSVKFDGSILSNGVYFYRLQAGNFVSNKKLLLLK